MKTRTFKLSLLLAVVLSVVTGMTVAPTTSAAKSAPNTDCSSVLQTPITGTAVDAAGNTATYNLCYTLQKFTAASGTLQAVGKVTGTWTDTVTGVTTNVRQTVTAPASASGTCSILDLTVGPIHLDLLGLVVDTNAIHLQITAQSGPGNLLGNLLCAVAGLLDNNGSLSQIVSLLNQIIDQL
jgi:hypothetical protein